MRLRILLKRIQQVFDQKKDNEKLMVNIGGRYFLRRHWRVLDFPSQHYRFMKGAVDYEYDLTSAEPFPFKNDSVFLIYSSHTLEHIPQEHCQFIFSEIFRVLKKGGGVRLTMPDFDKSVEAYRNGAMDYFKLYSGSNIEEKFLDNFASYWKNKVTPKELQKKFNSLPKEEFGDHYTTSIPRESQKKNTGFHINWWNYKKLHTMLTDAGFTNIYKSKEKESKFSEMRGTGRKKGFDTTHPEISVFIEAKK
jgi:predicted SAM-dependent methyltransferase